jgi:hypothetical protein
MLECSEEAETQHHLGTGHGFGPVLNSEYVYFAVFEFTKCDGNSLAADSFENKQLKKGGQSVCRASHTSRGEFDEQVVREGSNPKGKLKGVSAALVEQIRRIQSTIVLNSVSETVRSVCVLDYVLAEDYPSHATLNYGERTSEGLSESQAGKIRSRVRLDLADAFGPIEHVDQVNFISVSPQMPEQSAASLEASLDDPKAT